MDQCDRVLKSNVDFAVSGVEGTIYDLTIHVYGVVELRTDYVGGMRRQGPTANTESASDFLYTGGSYTPGKVTMSTVFGSNRQ